MAHSRNTMRLIVAAVAVVHGFKVSKLRSHNSKHVVSHPRHLAAYMARHLTALSYSQIATALGYLDHTTVLHGIRATTRRMAKDPQLTILVDHLTQIVQQMERYTWPTSDSANAPWLALVRLAGDIRPDDGTDKRILRPPHEISATLLCALVMDCGRLAAAQWPSLLPPRLPPQADATRVGTNVTLPPLLAYINDHAPADAAASADQAA